MCSWDAAAQVQAADTDQYLMLAAWCSG